MSTTDVAPRLFDLNIEEILDNWEVYHGIRELIANALDEQVLTNTAPIAITKAPDGEWHIRDFGRGISIEHFTLNENDEKLRAPDGIIGKFGVGLKDALATLARHEKGVVILSQHGTFRLRAAAKHGFDDIVTLHVEYRATPLVMQGTDVILLGVADDDINRAKSLFLAFADEVVVESTVYGQIIRRKAEAARVYINGVLASEEPNFLFSYNITSLTDAMKKRLNRERLNVGRTTYTDRVKAILRVATSKTVQDALADQVPLRATGNQADEMEWLEISQLAFNYLHQRRQVAFVTEQEVFRRPEVIDNLKRDGLTPVVVSDAHRAKIEKQARTGGPKLRTVETYVEDFNKSFEYRFVDADQLSRAERRVYDLTPKITALLGTSGTVPKVRISETMRITVDNTAGVWDPELPGIVILRRQLSDPESYAGTLLHELTHAMSKRSDVSREFESALTENLGKVAISALRSAGIRI